ncbi:ABC transporter ATP-binding protein [uncultured Pseudokineococcus sp.]|uniref:ABC transporter ATP-binding protein n=1 Tax=uncultured Pseudokineococcus sp. TaxID=1642928 RepID=UPI002630159C|nr:ABC transporter ATP-binding protein [uncultured Pseudokineococcus sp.]
MSPHPPSRGAGAPDDRSDVPPATGDDPVRGAAPLLEVRDLTVDFLRRGSEPARAVDGVSLSVRPGEVMGLVGESGSGKSVTSLAVMGLLPRRSSRVGGSVRLGGTELLGMAPRRLAGLRGDQMAMVFQDPMSSLNPVVPIGTQVTEVLRTHTDADRAAARDEAEDLLRRVGIPDPRRRLRDYPHQLSGGMRQRALIAIALACKPRLLIADEPTTALDVTIQAQVLELLRRLVGETGTAMLLITHDLGVVAGLCDDVTVMYSGRVVETAPRRELFARPAHRYTEGLLASVPRLDSSRGEPLRPIPGTPRDVLPWARACAFAPRCAHADRACADPGLALAGHPRLPEEHLARCVHPAVPEAATTGAGA